MASRVPSVENKRAACSRVFEDLADPIIVEDTSGAILDMNPEADVAHSAHSV